MFCPECGTQIPEGSAFCPNCGTRVGAAQQPPAGAASSPRQRDPYREAPAKKKSGFKPILLLCLVALAGFAAVKVTGLLGDDGGEPVEYKPNQKPETVTVQPQTAPGGENSASGGSTQTQPADPVQTQPGGSQTESGSGDTWNEQWLLGDTPASSGSSGSSGSAEQYSTDALPVETDFDWFFDRGAGTVRAAIPPGAEQISDPALLGGGWKCFVMRRPTTDPIRQYWNLELSFNGTEAACTQAWSGQVKSGGSFEDLSAANTNPLSGSIDSRGILTLKDDYGSELVIVQWYSVDGKQYGMGTYECGWDDADAMGLAAVCRP